MDIKQSLQNAVRNLAANKWRCLQAVLGMFIGIAGFILALSCCNVSLMFVQNEKEEYADSLLDMWVSTDVDYPVRITPEDMEQVAADNPEVISAISPYSEFDLPGGVRYGDAAADEAQVYGVGDSYLKMRPVLHLQEGRFFADLDIDRERKVCVIGNSIANDLLGGDALGKEIKVWGENYTVVGVLAEVPKSRTLNSEVYIPYTNARKMLGDRLDPYNAGIYEDKYYVYANGKDKMDEAQTLVLDMLKERTGRERRTVWWLTIISLGESSEMIKGFIIGDAVQQVFLAVIVLLIGGAGIMSVMLAGVQARTREIGVRKAFGATRRDIQRQFALEAVIIGLIGGGLGVIVGFGAFFLLILVMEVSFDYLIGAILPSLAAVAVSVLVGVLSGTYPARQAAKLEPVAAINCD